MATAQKLKEVKEAIKLKKEAFQGPAGLSEARLLAASLVVEVKFWCERSSQGPRSCI